MLFIEFKLFLNWLIKTYETVEFGELEEDELFGDGAAVDGAVVP